MLSYLEKFNKLPKDLKDKISSPGIMQSIAEIEKEFEIGLAVVIMRVMVKEVSIVDLAKFFVFENGLDGARANKLVEELKEKVFYDVFKYLDIEVSEIDVAEKAAQATAEISSNSYFKKNKTVPPVQSSNFFFSSDDEEEIKSLTKRLEGFGGDKNKAKKKEQDNNKKIDEIISKANLSFSSNEMNDRFRKIIDIYLKKIRNKIDTKQTMTKLIDSGGLGVSDNIADRILRVTDKINFVPENKKIEAEQSFESKKDVEPEEEKDSQNKENTEDKSFAQGAEPKSEDIEDEEKEQDKDFDVMNEVEKIAKGDTEYDFGKFKNVAKKVDEIIEPIKNSKEVVDIKEIEKTIESINLEAGGLKSVDLKEEGESDRNDKNSSDAKSLLPKERLVIEAVQDDREDNNPKSETTDQADDMVLDLSNKKKVKLEENTSDNDVNKNDLKKNKISDNNQKVEIGSGKNIKITRSASITHASAPDGKIKMEDVKYVPKLMGPIDELREMNLVNFRRLSQDPAEAARKIEEKIKFLEEDRYSKKVEGIKAWRSSPINKLYLEIGQEGIIVARGIENAIKAREKCKKDFLTLKEFNEIIDLNKRIRY